MTDFEDQQGRVLNNYAMMPSVKAENLTVNDFLINKLGGDPSQDILILCQKCGVTLDPECDYGGFHDESQWVKASVEWWPTVTTPRQEDASSDRISGEEPPDGGALSHRAR